MSIFKGRTAFITGATGGIGQSIAIKMASDGCNIIFNYRTEEKFNYTRDLLLKFDVMVQGIKCDFDVEEDVDKMLGFLDKCDIDLLVNSAGVFPIKNIQDSTLEDYERCFNVNVKIPFILSQRLGQKMCQSKWGRIINIGSSSSYNGSGDTGLYCASKHALLGLSRSLTKEYSEHNVRVYCISPGSSQTAMGMTDTRQDFSTFITPMEVAEYVHFIASFDSEGISEEFRINRMVIR
ncbi:MAG: SDR family oxidoreductase [Rhodobiaceae bacterium]|nr:SDR family oxidoreductase [Rhodobiaceae bacterium]